MTLAATLTAITCPAIGQNLRPTTSNHQEMLIAEKIYDTVQYWVTAGQTSKIAHPIYLPNTVGVKVTLRWHAMTIAQGQATIDNLNPPVQSSSQANAIDILAIAQIATEKALAQAKDTLRAAHYRAVTTTTQPGTTHPKSLTDVGPLLQIDLQIARNPQPIRIASSKDRKTIYTTFAPGFHALRMTSKSAPLATPPDTPPDTPSAPPPNTTTHAWSWPASTLAANTSQWSQLIQLLNQAGYRIDDFPTIARPGGPTLEKFDVIHLTRPDPDAPPIRLVRGVTPRPPHTISDPELQSIAERLTAFLLTRQMDDGRLAGTYRPSLDRYDPPVAPPNDIALAAYALGRRARYLADAEPNHPQQQQANNAARRAITHLIKQTPPDTDTRSPALIALLVTCLTDTPALAEGAHRNTRDTLIAQLLTQQNNPNITTAPTTQALALLALTHAYQRTRDPALLTTILKTRAALWQDADPTSLLLLKRLPWQALAELRIRHALANQNNTPPNDKRTERPDHTAQLLQLIDTLRRHQITTHPNAYPNLSALPNHGPAGPADVVGGFEFRRTTGPPLPDWNSARALFFMAAALRDDQLTAGQDLVGWMLNCGLAARFLDQLAFDQAGCYYVRSRADALGGVRISPIDNRLAIGPTATALLAITELQESLRHLAQKTTPQVTPPPPPAIPPVTPSNATPPQPNPRPAERTAPG